MTITLELKPEVEERLRENAAGAGLTVEEYLLEIAERYGAPSPDYKSGNLERLKLSQEKGAYPPGSLAELFAQWQAEDATDDPEELERRDRELEELKANLNANRAANGEEPLFP